MGEGGDGGEENMAAWLLGINNLKVLPYKLPPLGPNDVRVRMKAVGICGTDVHYLKTMRMTHYVVKEPMVIGHECAGIIEELGSEVKSLAVGDRVAVEPGMTCGRCKYCKAGRYNLCDDTKSLGLPPIHGSLANQLVHPADLCFKLPDNVNLEEGAMCEPLSVGVHACRRANINPETNVLIVGAGTIGLVTMFTARAFGSPRIVIADVDEQRLLIAKSLGADEFVKVSPSIEKDFRWLPEHGSRIITNFEKRGTTHLRDMFTDIRKSGQYPLRIGEGVWADLSRAWASPEFTKLREQNKQNRASDCGGLGSSLHTGGLVPHTENRRRLTEFLGREPTPLAAYYDSPTSS